MQLKNKTLQRRRKDVQKRMKIICNFESKHKNRLVFMFMFTRNKTYKILNYSIKMDWQKK